MPQLGRMDILETQGAEMEQMGGVLKVLDFGLFDEMG